MTEHDVLIIGAGPSGLETARRLSERGLSVLVLEKKDRVGESVNCTGLIGAEIFDKFGLDLGSILRRVQDVRLVSPKGTSLEYKHSSCFAYVVDRDRFDRSIAEAASAAGAEIRTGAEVTNISWTRSAVEARVATAGRDDYMTTARLAVIATGVHQDLNRKAGLGSPRHFLHGAQMEAEAGDVVVPTIFAGNAIAPGGFAWAVPSRQGMAKYGLVTDGDARAGFEVFRKKYLDGKVEGSDENKVHVKAIAQGLISRTYGRRVLAVGEAAGQVKTTTGGGVAFGLLCADIAADVIARAFGAGRFTDSALADYEKLWKGELRTEILLGSYARRIWARLSDARIEKVFQFARMDGVIPLIREKAEFDHHGELILALLRRFSLFGILDGVAHKIPHFN